jgi:hypothetical protein
VTAPEPGRVLRWALLGWGLGHRLLGRRTLGAALLAAEVLGALAVAWLTIGLADSSLYLVPFLAGVLFLVAWGWQAVDAYREAHARTAARGPTPERSPAVAIGWLSLPLLAWGTGFWLIGAHTATPAATVDRFVSAWTSDALVGGDWPADVVEAADAAASGLGDGPDRFRDLRFTITDAGATHATAVGEAIHYERRDTSFLWVFAGSELVPVGDRTVLSLDLATAPAQLPGGGDVGAVRWQIVGADASP